MTEQTDTPAALTAAEIAAIAERLARIPGGDWHSALGSGHSAMTAVMADVPDGDDDYEPVFICDVIPDYRMEDPQVWKNRVPLLEFIANAPTDMQWLIDRLAAAEQRAARSAQTIDGLIRERDAAEQRAEEMIAWHEGLFNDADTNPMGVWFTQAGGERMYHLTRVVSKPSDATVPAREAVIEAAREVIREGDHAWREHAHNILALGSHTQYFVLPAINRLRRMLLALDATERERAPTDTTEGEAT